MAIIVIGGLVYKKMEMNKLWHQQISDKKRSMAAKLSFKRSEITSEVKAARKSTKSAALASELLKLEHDFDLFVRSKEDNIIGVSDEMGLVKIQYELESGTWDFDYKLDEAKKMIEQKDSTLENINRCGKEVDNFYSNILLNIPASPDENYIDFSNLEKRIQPLKAEAATFFEGNHFFKLFLKSSSKLLV